MPEAPGTQKRKGGAGKQQPAPPEANSDKREACKETFPELANQSLCTGVLAAASSISSALWRTPWR
jgi:hypothetical protein